MACLTTPSCSRVVASTNYFVGGVRRRTSKKLWRVLVGLPASSRGANLLFRQRVRKVKGLSGKAKTDCPAAANAISCSTSGADLVTVRVSGLITVGLSTAAAAARLPVLRPTLALWRVATAPGISFA